MTASDTHSDLDQLPAATPSAAPSADAALRRRLWAEVVVVLLVAVVPSLVAAVTYWIARVPHGTAIIPDMAGLLANSAACAALVLYLMWRSGEGWAAFGMPRPHVGMDGVLAVVLLVVGYMIYGLYASSIGLYVWELDPWSGYEDSFGVPSGAVEWLITVVAMIANAFSEEVVLWGFLFTRLRVLLGSAAWSVILVSVTFGSYHIYQGAYGAGSAMVGGLLHGAVFAVLPRLWPLVAAHAAWDVLVYAMA